MNPLFFPAIFGGYVLPARKFLVDKQTNGYITLPVKLSEISLIFFDLQPSPDCKSECEAVSGVALSAVRFRTGGIFCDLGDLICPDREPDHADAPVSKSGSGVMVRLPGRNG